MNIIQKAGLAIAAGTFALGAAAPVLAQEAPTPGAGVRPTAANTEVVANRIAKAKERATQEIDRRITMLTQGNERVQAMKHVSDAIKSSIASTVTEEISSLNTLKTKIASETELAALREDIASITKSYRIFLLVIPQARITVAADKVKTAATSLSTLAGKLQERITAASAAGVDVSVMNASLADMNAKITDAMAQADAAVAAVASLQPDNGDKAVQKANTDALKSAREKLRTGQDDIETARKDAHEIVKALKAAGAGSSAGANEAAPGQLE